MAEDPHCRYCRCRLNAVDNDDRQATIDHIIPSSLGGSDQWDNLQLLCRQCNGEKGATVGRSRNVVAWGHSLRGAAGSGYHKVDKGLSTRQVIEEQLEEVMSRCDYCSGFGCIGECHDLPSPGAPISLTVSVDPVVTAVADADILGMLAAETGQAGRPGWFVIQSGPAFWGYGRPWAAVWPEGPGRWGWRVYASPDVIETSEGMAGSAWAAMLAAEDRLSGRSVDTCNDEEKA